MRRMLAITVLMLMASVPVLAHDGHVHPILGTVTMLHEKHLMIRTPEGKELTFTLSAATKYSKGDKPATRNDLAEGARVTVQLSEDGKNVVAVTIAEVNPK